MKKIPLVFAIAFLSTLLLSGCGAQICAFGNIGDGCPKASSSNSNNNAVSGNQIILEAPSSEVKWNGRLTIKYRGGRSPLDIRITDGYAATLTNRTNNTFDFVPGTGGTGRQKSTITAFGKDFDQRYGKDAQVNQGKYAEIDIRIVP